MPVKVKFLSKIKRRNPLSNTNVSLHVSRSKTIIFFILIFILLSFLAPTVAVGFIYKGHQPWEISSIFLTQIVFFFLSHLRTFILKLLVCESLFSYHKEEEVATMGGGNGQKSKMARERNSEKQKGNKGWFFFFFRGQQQKHNWFFLFYYHVCLSP